MMNGYRYGENPDSNPMTRLCVQVSPKPAVDIEELFKAAETPCTLIAIINATAKRMPNKLPKTGIFASAGNRPKTNGTLNEMNAAAIAKMKACTPCPKRCCGTATSRCTRIISYSPINAPNRIAGKTTSVAMIASFAFFNLQSYLKVTGRHTRSKGDFQQDP